MTSVKNIIHKSALSQLYAALFVLLCLQSLAQKNTSLSYTVAQNYFIKNTYIDGDLKSHKISDAVTFERYVGAAAVMGENGKPTSIDFTKQFIIIVAEPITNSLTELRPLKLSLTSKTTLLLNLRVQTSEPSTYSMRPCLFLLVDRKYKNAKIVIVKS